MSADLSEDRTVITPDKRLEVFCVALAYAYKLFEQQGGAAYADRDASFVEYVVRMLAEPELNGSAWVLESILFHRSMATPGEKRQ